MEKNHSDKDAILAQWLNGEISADDAKQHLSDEEYVKYMQILAEIDEWTPDHSSEVVDLNEIFQSKKDTKVIQWTNWKYLSIAAVVVLAVFIGPLLYQTLTTVSYETAYGESKEILLPDGSSKLFLSANSRVSWKKEDWKKRKRRLSLEGKAYIEVPEKGSFDVITSEGEVSVLGTRFTVYQIDQALHAVCYEGRVRAKSKKGDSIDLNKGESSLLEDGNWSAKKLFDIEYPEWVNGNISFDNAPLKLVLDELNANYGIKVELGNVNLARRFTGSIPKDNLDQALKIVFPTLSITYRLKDNTLYLSE